MKTRKYNLFAIYVPRFTLKIFKKKKTTTTNENQNRVKLV